MYSSANGVYCGVEQLPNSSAETKYNILLEKVVNENLARLGCKIAIIEEEEKQINNEVYRITFETVD